MSRFSFSEGARRDLAELRMHLRSIPDVPARKIAVALQMTFRSIAENPYQGAGQSELTRISGAEIRSRLVQSFRIFYIVSGIAPEIVGVLHTARDISSIMAKRLQLTTPLEVRPDAGRAVLRTLYALRAKTL